MITSVHHDALSKAKIQLMATPDSVFFTTLCFSLVHEFSEDIPTACTNGKRVQYNPEFFMGLRPEERVFLLLHETLHCAYLHMARLKDLEPRKWNIAADHVINLQLKARGFVMPKDGLADEIYTGMSTEEVYAALPDNPTADVNMDLEPGDAESDKSLEKEMQDILVRARLQSKMTGDKPGTIPGEIEIFLNRLLNPKLPWQRILQKYIQTYAMNDYSYRKPNRRFMPDFYLPTLISENLIDIAVAVDTSGSVTDDEFLRFISETSSILRMMKPETLTLIQFDSEIRSVDRVKTLRDLSQVSFTGRGGTRIEPVINWANTNRPQLLLVFTDGEFYFHNAATKVDVIWLIHGGRDFTPPFGKKINYEI